MLVLPLLFAVTESRADDEHYINIIVGERPAGLGGAYTAVSNDTAGLFYNPAGIVYTEGQNLSVSVNSFYASSKVYENAIGNNAWERTSSSIVPNFFGLSKPFGPGVVGFSYAVPDTIIEDQDQIFDNLQDYGISEFRMNFNKEDTTINAGPSYALELGGGFSTGFTLYYHNRKYKTLQNEFTRYIAGDYRWVSKNRRIEENGLRPLLGFMYSPEESAMTIGLAVSKTFLVNASTKVNDRYRFLNDTIVYELPLDLTVKREFPLNIKMGFSYRFSEKLFYTMDISHFTATPVAEEAVYIAGLINEDYPVRYAKVAIWNFAGGIEYSFSDKYKFRTGAYSNMSPAYPIGEESSDGKIDIYGISFCVSQITAGSSVDIGMSFSYGRGEYLSAGSEEAILDEGIPYTIESATTQSMLFFLGTSHAY